MTKDRKPISIYVPIAIEPMKDHIVGTFKIDNHISINIRFDSPEQLLEFFSRMMEAAAVVWPDNDWIREYLSEE